LASRSRRSRRIRHRPCPRDAPVSQCRSREAGACGLASRSRRSRRIRHRPCAADAPVSQCCSVEAGAACWHRARGARVESATAHAHGMLPSRSGVPARREFSVWPRARVARVESATAHWPGNAPVSQWRSREAGVFGVASRSRRSRRIRHRSALSGSDVTWVVCSFRING
jgi:hypothetical protein